VKNLATSAVTVLVARRANEKITFEGRKNHSEKNAEGKKEGDVNTHAPERANWVFRLEPDEGTKRSRREMVTRVKHQKKLFSRKGEKAISITPGC